MNQQFEYFDFTPRKEFEEKANEVLNTLKSQIPFSCQCEARCTYFANKFFFQIIFRNDEVIFSAQSILDPKKENTSERGWQVKAIDSMSSLLKAQLEKFSEPLSQLKVI